MLKVAHRPEVETPSTLRPASLRSAVDQALRLIAYDIWQLIADPLAETYGQEWQETLAEDHSINRQDASSIVSLLLTERAEIRDDVRDAFGRARWGDMYRRHAFRDVRRIRNEYAHPDGSADLAWTEHALSRLMSASRVGELACFDEIQQLTAAVQTLKRGGQTIPDAAEVEASRRAYDEARREAEEAAARAETAEGQLAQAQDEQARADAELGAARLRIHELETTARTSQDHDATLRATLEEARAAHRDALSALQEREHRLTELEDARTRTERRLEEAEQRLLSDEAVIAVTAHEQPQIGADQQAELERLLQALRDRPTYAAPSPPAQAGAPLPHPGEPWSFPRGNAVWRLSRQRRQLVRAEDDVDLAHVLGRTRAQELVAQFLAIRPAGGRVWVDVDGDAVTYVDARLVYLGRLTLAARSQDPQPGEPVSLEHTRSYVMSGKGRIESVSTGETLDGAVSTKVANDVAERIRQVKPKGGRLKVSRDGVVAAFVDRQWVFVTRVGRQEWFPGHIQ